MQLFSRVTNSFVNTSALAAVIIGSLCFSVGEGLRLTPFPNSAVSRIDNSDTAIDSGGSRESSVSKYGPLDVPSQKRSKRTALEFASGSTVSEESGFKSVVHLFQYKADDLNCLLLIASQSGRAPPPQS
jgi:hypothetical protein